METTKVINVSPLVVLGAGILLFGAWIAYESIQAPEKHASDVRHPIPRPGLEPGGPPPEAALGAVHPGVPRTFIERLFVSVPPPEVEPIDMTSGAPVLRSRYHLVLNHPVPHLMPDVHPREIRPGLYILVLEFDGSKPGHPLLHADLLPMP